MGMASPVIKLMVRQSKRQSRSRSRKKPISIGGVPHGAVHVFLGFLYSCYEDEEMKQYVMHLLVLSHAFGVSSLKKLCVEKLEKELLNLETVVDLLQLGRLCDAPRLSLLCNRIIIDNFEAVSASEGWKVMKQSNPCMEKEILDSVVQADLQKRERWKKMEERKIYLQLHEAMEALVHICRDGCRTIGPHDKVLKRSSAPLHFPSMQRIGVSGSPLRRLQKQSSWWLHPLQENVATPGTSLSALRAESWRLQGASLLAFQGEGEESEQEGRGEAEIVGKQSVGG